MLCPGWRRGFSLVWVWTLFASSEGPCSVILGVASSASCQRETAQELSGGTNGTQSRAAIVSLHLGILFLYHGCCFMQQYISLAKSQRATTPLADVATLSTSQCPQCSAREVSTSFVRDMNTQIMTMNLSQLSEQFRDLTTFLSKWSCIT